MNVSEAIGRQATVKVPATSANLGPGYDSLGLALSIYDVVTGRVVAGQTRVTITGEGESTLPSDESHLVAKSFALTCQHIGLAPVGLALHCRNNIPQARGLGSSSAAIVAGVLLARHLMQVDTMDDSEILAIASSIEGHPDNVAACIRGDFTIAWTSNGRALAVRQSTVSGLCPVAYVPAGRGITTQARAALPATVAHRDAAFNVSRSALAVYAFTQDASQLMDATEDRLHQGYRAGRMPDSVELVNTLRAQGIPAMISGAGPSVLAFTASPPHHAGFLAHAVQVTRGACQIFDIDPQVLPSV